MNKITEAFQAMNLMKKRYLQIEYLGKSEKLAFSRCMNDIQNMEDLAEALEEDIEYMEGYITEAIIEFLDNGDYEVYTNDHHGRKFWNQIELPHQVQRYFDIFQKIMCGGLKDTSKYELQFYDLYPNSLFFDDLETLEKLIGAEDFVPFTVFENDGESSVELYSA